MKKDLAILWFRHDLRLHDNEALYHIAASSDSFLPVYVFDSRLIFGELPSGLPRMYRTRIQFLLESIHDLRRNLRELGSDLVVRVGEPEKVLYELAENYNAAGVYCNRERMPHEAYVQDTLEKSLWTLGQEMHYYKGKMLIYTSDLPFPIVRTPDQYSSFLKETENFISVRRPIFSREQRFQFPDLDLDPGPIPKLSDFGYDDSYTNMEFTGGETAGESQLMQNLYEIANHGSEHLCISPWLALGNLSPKHIYYEVEGNEGLDESFSRSFKRKLILRDFYRLTGKKEPVTLFSEGGFRQKTDKVGKWEPSLLRKWIAGNTGHDYVDACMKCLSETGYLSHLQRKAVSHFLIDEMQVHWLLGAGYFQSVLLDYDPCSNYGNWQRVAGLSLDLKGRHRSNFDLIEEQMDPEGCFRQRWADYQVPMDNFRLEARSLIVFPKP